MTAQQVQQLIDLVKGASTVLWKAALEQVYATLVLDAVWVVLFTVLFVVGVRLCRQNGSAWNDVNWSTACSKLLVGAILTVSFLPLLYNITGLVQLIIAPDYAAIQKLTELVPH